MAVEASAYIAYGLIYNLDELTELRDIFRDEDKHILSPANIARDNDIFNQVELSLIDVLPQCLTVETSADTVGGGISPALIVCARSTKMEIDFKNRPFDALSFRDFAKPTDEEIDALKVFGRKDEFGFDDDLRTPELIVWGWVS